MNNTYLYKYDTKGKVRQWKGWVEANSDGTYTIKIEHGLQDGKLITKERLVKKGKNIGKANETTVEQQALSDLSSLYQKQLDDGYVASLDDYREPLRPMLAHKYQDKTKHVVWASENDLKVYNFASKKLDGIRCFIIIDEEGNIQFKSRTDKPFKVFKHISDKLSELRNCILDGELYSEVVPFEGICSHVNSSEYNPETDTNIHFFIYDLIDLGNTKEAFRDRYLKYQQLFKAYQDDESYPIKVVEQVSIKSLEELKSYHDNWVQQGYEGLMLKNPYGVYEFGKRSNNLLKYKEMQTDEYKIKDIFLAENDNQRVQMEFYKDPREPEITFKIGTVKGNKEDVYNTYYLNKNEYIGKWATVQYQTLTGANGVPLFPQFISMREGTEDNGVFTPSV